MEFSSKSFAVLWSPSQMVFHIQTISEMIKINRDVLEKLNDSDFIVLAIYNSRSDADAACNALKNRYKNVST